MRRRLPYPEMKDRTLTKLALISERSRKEPELQFISLAHLLDVGLLRGCYFELGRDRASGIDGVSWQEYGEQLDENLENLVDRMKAREWWPILAAKLRGHYQYYGVSGNMRSLNRFYLKTVRLTLKWLNRRSQRKRFYGKGFIEYLKHYPLPRPRIEHNFYTLSPVK